MAAGSPRCSNGGNRIRPRTAGVWKGEPLTDEQVRKLTGLHQMDIDIAAEQLEAEGMITITRRYSLEEE